MKVSYAHYTNFGCSMAPWCADQDGYLSYRDGFETEIPEENWTSAERWIAALHEERRQTGYYDR